MHKEVLSVNQLEILPLVKKFIREYYLAGGTAVALHIGHRRSIDFDLFRYNPLNHKKIIEKISDSGYSFTIRRKAAEQMNVMFTFLEYPFKIKIIPEFEEKLKLPELIDLAAMKAYAFGRRSKWKDYVDIYFLLKNYFSIEEISARANEIFDQLFSEKFFRIRLSYFDDIDYTEPVDFIKPSVSPEEIREFLISKAIDLGGTLR